MSEPLSADLADAEDFFRRGEQTSAVADESAWGPLLEVEASECPSLEWLEELARRRARYTRWVTAAMTILGLGSIIVFVTNAR